MVSLQKITGSKNNEVPKKFASNSVKASLLQDIENPSNLDAMNLFGGWTFYSAALSREFHLISFQELSLSNVSDFDILAK